MAIPDVPAVIRTKLVDDGFSDVVSGSRWPDKRTAADAILVLLAPGPTPGAAYGAAIEYAKIGFQILVRSASEGTARTNALAIYNSLRYFQPPGWISVRPVGNPIPIGDDEDGLVLYSINFLAEIHA